MSLRLPAIQKAAALAVVTLIWGSTWAAIRVGLEGVPPFAGVALRFGVAALILLALARVLGARMGTGRREVGLWLINGLGTFVFTYGTVYWAEQRVPSGLTSVLFATFPLFVAVLAHFGLPGDRLRAIAVLGVVAGFAGVAVIFSEDLAAVGAPGASGAAGLLLVASFAAAAANVAVKRWGEGIHPVALIAPPMALAAVLMGIASLVFERGRPLVLDAVSAGTVLYLAVFGSVVTFSLYFWLLQRMRASRLALINYLSPVFAVALGAALFGEQLTPRVVAGAALVIAGVAVTTSGR